MSGRRIPAILGRGGISRNWATAHFLILMVGSSTDKFKKKSRVVGAGEGRRNLQVKKNI